MGKIIFEDMSSQPESVEGYYNPFTDEIYVDSSLPRERQLEVLIHEVLESFFRDSLSHVAIVKLTTELYLGIRILEERYDATKQ